jgi:hypothetical protein
MLSFIRKKFSIKRKTLRKNIHQYISKKKDICCEEDVDRDTIIDSLFELYRNGDDPLETLHNDFCKFIGYKNNLKAARDHQGLALWDQIDQAGYKDKQINEEEVKKSLHEVPLYFLLSFLGYGYYKFKGELKPIVQPETPKMDTEQDSLPPTITPEESTLMTQSNTPKI